MTVPPARSGLGIAADLEPRLLLGVHLDGARIAEHQVDAEGLTLGGDAAALPLPGPGLEGTRASLEVDAEGWWIREDSPSGMVFVDHLALEGRRRLARGARIYVGRHRIDVLACDGARAPAGPRQPATSGAMARPRLGVAAIAAATAISLVAAIVAVSSADEDPRDPPATLRDRAGRQHGAASPSPSTPSTPSKPPLRGSPILAAAVRSRSVLQDMSSRTWPMRPVESAPATPAAAAPVRVEHEVIAGETIAAIAARYRASAARIAEDNRLRPDRPLSAGQRLVIEAVDPPLPRQRLRIQVADGDTWSDLHARYGLGEAEIRGQNPGLGDALPAGATLDLWVEPQVARRRPISDDVDYPVLGVGRSIGSPSSGRLDGGIELPESPLYIRRNPRIMFGSAHAIAALQRAIHRFRRAYAYEGVLVVADLSRPLGGPLPPHLSHQSGRDVDIWLPTLRGAYDQRYLAEDRRPSPDEVNWLATWGLIDSLLATGSVHYIFLSKSIQDRLYRAAEGMGATPGELAKIQWQPEGVDDRSPAVVAPIRDAFGHTGHIHVRFTCGPGELECLAHATKVDEP